MGREHEETNLRGNGGESRILSSPLDFQVPGFVVLIVSFMILLRCTANTPNQVLFVAPTFYDLPLPCPYPLPPELEPPQIDLSSPLETHTTQHVSFQTPCSLFSVSCNHPKSVLPIRQSELTVKC